MAGPLPPQIAVNRIGFLTDVFVSNAILQRDPEHSFHGSMSDIELVNFEYIRQLLQCKHISWSSSSPTLSNFCYLIQTLYKYYYIDR